MTTALFGNDQDIPYNAIEDATLLPAHTSYATTATAFAQARKEAVAYKIRTEYGETRTLPAALGARQGGQSSLPAKRAKIQGKSAEVAQQLIEEVAPRTQAEDLSQQLAIRRPAATSHDSQTTALARRAAVEQLKPTWHAPWKLSRVIAGHAGWVRCVSFDPLNQFFVTGSADRTIKIWDLASGTLRLSLTGHISTVRGVAVSARHPYLFSCGEDKQVKCWDLESNKVIRHYHGHLSGVYALSLHPTIDVLVTSGRDAVARCWDMRTRESVHVLGGHKATVADVQTCAVDPQVITGSLDHTVKLWDLAAGKCMQTLTHHKRSIRSISTSLTERSFISGGADRMRTWTLPAGQLLNVMEGPGSDLPGGGIVNTTSVNVDNVLFAGSDDGSLGFYDYKSGHCFQSTRSAVQPGSLESENGLFCSAFDRTGLRLVTGEADKTIKVWKQDDTATPDTHPLQWTPSLQRRKF
ncbi:WD40-repeat-containing domain protein [Protomyces lactucae-debilis]|uniref:Pre-mRNA-splicing factor PRP46 n=1 Tax=Protomyces lactucae-debilis TaxID=2754530 RepID=A0A1Y2EV02_PROLT|nr:WD40-repeat-containing domain protein [Protomyces lactucae-debilis]ORY75431.1 WD40-repeat-containing domain protein [Protomyces lactucae-debilis]